MGVMEETDNTKARKPGPLCIIQYSLTGPHVWRTRLGVVFVMLSRLRASDGFSSPLLPPTYTHCSDRKKQNRNIQLTLSMFLTCKVITSALTLSFLKRHYIHKLSVVYADLQHGKSSAVLR